ncbi:MAG: Aconitate hydratase [Candidatus Heimdallarchaeota archaeon LC_3]|nr:MAG: Aconitate hydratase [Candidatus Heimdallarchaeota archaeon LC_3]
MTSVLSGNRNFTGRVHTLTSGNFLASPMLVMAYALAGTSKINLRIDPLGMDENNNPVFLKDLWPSQEEILRCMQEGINSEMFQQTYDTILEGDEKWKSLEAEKSIQYPWDPKSTYIKPTPFF